MFYFINSKNLGITFEQGLIVFYEGVTSKNETTNSPILEFKVLQNVFKM